MNKEDVIESGSESENDSDDMSNVSDDDVAKLGEFDPDGYDNDNDDENLSDINEDEENIEEGSNDGGNDSEDDENPEIHGGKQDEGQYQQSFNINDDEDDDDDESYLQKFDDYVKEKVVQTHHPETLVHNNEEVQTACTVVRDDFGNIIDPLHTTLPLLTCYEKARILGERATQLNNGAKPLIDVDETMIDGYVIAMKELEAKKIPFIIQRPLPNGTSEYWRLKDLEIY